MRLRGRPEDHDELVPVARLDEPERPSSTRVVELTPRRRGRELALVAVAMAVVIGVGLVDDGGGSGDVSAEPTTTSTRRPSTTRKKPTAQRRVTTTTSWPQFEAGSGPLLPGELEATYIGVVSGSGRVTVVELTTGDRCETMPTSAGWMPWNLQVPSGRLLVQTNRSLVAVDRTCTMTPLELHVDLLSPSLMTEDRVWVTSVHSPYVVEHSFPDGVATGRTIDVPRFGSSQLFAVGDDVLLATMGDMTLVDPDTGDRTPLGTGTPLATHGDLVAFTHCPEARCRLGFLNSNTGARRTLDDIAPVAWNQSRFSNDGRLLQISVAGARSDQPVGAIVDVTSGSMRVLDDPMQQAVFTSDNRWLVASFDGRTTAYRVDGSEVYALEVLRGRQGLAVL